MVAQQQQQQPSTEPIVASVSMPLDFLVGNPSLWAGGCAPPSHFGPLHHMVCSCQVISSTLPLTTCCAHRLFYSFTASDGSERTTAGRVVSPCSIMVHHRKQYIDYVKRHHTPHCWFSDMVMYPAISANRFSWLTRSAPISIIEERSNLFIVMQTDDEMVFPIVCHGS